MADTRTKQPKGVKLDHISKIYKDPKTGKEFYAVHDVALEMKPGSFITLLGPSGCGKTTTLRMIAGFESPDEGEIYLGGEPINGTTASVSETEGIASDASVAFTNTRNGMVPTGVALSLLPGIALIGVGGGFAVAASRKKKEDEE